jgi:signal transduction histidine kinase
MTRWLGTILTRIFWLHLTTVMAAALGMAVAIYLLLNATLATFERHALGQHAAAIAAALKPAQGGLRLDLPADLRDLYAEHYGGYAFAIVDAAGRPMFSSLPNGAALSAIDPRRSAPSFLQSTHGGDTFYGASYPQRVAGRAIWVQVRQDLGDPDVFVDDVVAQFLRRIGWLIAPIVLLLLAVDILIVQHALAPLREASRRAAAIDPARLDVRLPVQGLPSEIMPLVVAMNRALDRLEAGFRIQRDFTADAAHELRTPLAILRLRADALADRDAARHLRADIDAMSRLVEQLLAIAELETFALSPNDRADLRAIGLEASSVMAPLAIAAGKQLELLVEDTPIWVCGQAEVLLRAVRNLVENAIAHTPVGGSVTIAVASDGVVSVSDDGPGVAERERELVFQRFWRRERQTTQSGGLGLSIVQQIVQAHGGSIEVGSTPRGGARFEMRLRSAGTMQIAAD